MVNVIKDIVNKLEGYSSDNQGFAVISAKVNEDSGIALKVQPYIKNEEIEGISEENYLTEMISRLLSRYSDTPHYAVYKAEKVDGCWELLVQEIQKKTENNSEREQN